MRTQNSMDPVVPDEGIFRSHNDPIPRGTRLLGKYIVERTLGQGGMGIVVAARHETLEELVAIKFLLPAAMTNHQAVERFLREARASARVKSDHVVSVQDVGTLGTGEPYMIMEYLEGEDLKSVLRQRGPLPILEATEYAVQVCKGMAAAHAKNIVHRDLKPANLFLTKLADGTSRVKVFDFGIARIVEPNEEDLTRNDIVGSLAYMSPEQLLKSRTADWRTDIWSLGVILCELLTTKRPFDGEGRHELIANIFEAEPRPLGTWRADVPPAVEFVLRRCLHKDRTERYQSAHEVALALCEAVGLPPLMRAPMTSVSFLEPNGLPETEVIAHGTAETPSSVPAKHDEMAKTDADFCVTRHPASSVRGNRSKPLLAGASALVATSAAVVGLVVSLRGSKAGLIAASTRATGDASSVAMPIVPLTRPTAPMDIADAGNLEGKLDTGPSGAIGATIGKTASAIPKLLVMPASPAISALLPASPAPSPTTEPGVVNAIPTNDVPAMAPTQPSSLPLSVPTARPPITRTPTENELSDLRPD